LPDGLLEVPDRRRAPEALHFRGDLPTGPLGRDGRTLRAEIDEEALAAEAQRQGSSVMIHPSATGTAMTAS
jgi:hypothetical protein